MLYRASESFILHIMFTFVFVTCKSFFRLALWFYDNNNRFIDKINEFIGCIWLLVNLVEKLCATFCVSVEKIGNLIGWKYLSNKFFTLLKSC